MSDLSQAGCASERRQEDFVRRIGVFGGTFNPVHRGHLHAAREAAQCLGLGKVLFIPCAVPPHKEEAPIAPAQARLAWLQKAIENDPRFDVDDLELKRTGPSYSVDTLEILHQKFPNARLVFLIGLDAFRELDTWKTPDRLFEFADFAVMTRPPNSHATLADNLPHCLLDALELSSDGKTALHRRTQAKIILLEIAALEISATEIREKLRTNDIGAVRALLPENICDAVVQSALYREANSTDLETNHKRKPKGKRLAKTQISSATKTQYIAQAAADKRGLDLVALDVHKLSSIADRFLFVTSTSDRHARAIADAIREALSAVGEKPLGIEGYEEGRWILVDFGDVIAHIFQDEVRKHYDLERLWNDAPVVALNLEDESRRSQVQ